jgi:alanyl-tRNA synthetase
LNSDQARSAFLNYFANHGHAVVPSSPVVPHDDPTLLFTNAGMNQFKEVFLGEGRRDYARATSSQKCIRVGGKHNDLENVGHTTRHVTFFEMLGNFSFGDYFKEEAIRHAWTVSTELFCMDGERIWASVFQEDDEAFEIWRQYLPAERIVRLGERENFWMMGETGPCGPCSELLYDRGSQYGSAASPYEDSDGERFPEFWNLVFMQYNRDATGRMAALPKKNIDTGMGLERLLAFLGGFSSVFETDVLRSLIRETERLSGLSYSGQPAFHVVADHLRSLAFAIADGAQPSNVDRGYVLRKVLRRAVRYGRQLGFEKPFLAQLVPTLVKEMGSHFSELKSAQGRIEEIVTLEEEAFQRTLRRGGNLLSQVVESAKKRADQLMSGDDAFKLKDTYGLPLEEILLLAKDDNVAVDLERYQALEQEARDRSRRERKVVAQVASESQFADLVAKRGESRFTGYEEGTGEGEVIGLFVDGQPVDQIAQGDEALVVLNRTPFYAEKGGQIGDIGELQAPGVRFVVTDAQAPYTGVVAHIGVLEEGALSLGMRVAAQIDLSRRQQIANNHTATHLLHWALQKVLGDQIRQAGSLVAPDRLRFDFNHHKGMTPEEIRQVEDLVNGRIWENESVSTSEISYAEVQRHPEIKQFFGDKYGSLVRVVAIGDFSKELCGGTHVDRVGRIGCLTVVSESSIAAGVRRIEAVTGRAAIEQMRSKEDLIEEIAGLLKSSPSKLLDRVNRLLEEQTHYAQEMKRARERREADLAKELATQAVEVSGIPLVSAVVDVEPSDLRSLVGQIARQRPEAVVVLGSGGEEMCTLVASVPQYWVDRGLSAGSIVQELAPIVDGKGGGKPAFAQAGGKSPRKLPDAILAAREVVTRFVSRSS